MTHGLGHVPSRVVVRFQGEGVVAMEEGTAKRAWGLEEEDRFLYGQ